MDRSTFLKTLAALPIGAASAKLFSGMQLNDFRHLSLNLPDSPKMPVLFVGHGNPMNAILETQYSKTWQKIGKELPLPKAILCISAHWLTNGTSVAVTAKPETIHDFGGFPQALFDVQYPAPGAPAYAKFTASQLTTTAVTEDNQWGLDHGAWSVIKHMYPAANIPVFQLSIDFRKNAAWHYELGTQLTALREKGVLIVASGNIVHNLGMVSWNEPDKQYDWAIEFDNMVKKSIEDNNPAALTSFDKLGNLAKLAHPTPDHYYPLLYAVGLRRKDDHFSFFNDSFDLGSISMRSVMLT